MTYIITASGRRYEVDYDNKKYSNDWVYYKDENDETIIGFSKAQVEAEVWQDDRVVQSHVNNNEA